MKKLINNFYLFSEDKKYEFIYDFFIQTVKDFYEINELFGLSIIGKEELINENLKIDLKNICLSNLDEKFIEYEYITPEKLRKGNLSSNLNYDTLFPYEKNIAIKVIDKEILDKLKESNDFKTIEAESLIKLREKNIEIIVYTKIGDKNNK